MIDNCELRPMDLPPLPENPLVSVLIANYNNARFLPEALDSVLAQTYTNWEAIICDDGSTDNSRQVIEQYLALDSRFRCVFKRNGGVATALNAAYLESKGDVIAFLDADDFFYRDKCALVVNRFQVNHLAGFAGHQLTPVNERGKATGPAIPRLMEEGWLGPKALVGGGRCELPPGGGLVFRRELAEVLFPIPDAFHRRAADGYLLGIAQLASVFVAVTAPLAAYRIHTANVTAACKPTVGTVQKTLEDYEKISVTQREFLCRMYGEATARTLDVVSCPTYKQNLLAYRLLAGTLPASAQTFSVAEIISGLPNKSLKFIWRTLLWLPPSVGRMALCLWHGQYRGKQLLHPLALAAGLK